MFAFGHTLVGIRLALDAARTAVVAHAIHGGVVDDDGLIDVGVVDDGDVHVGNGCVIGEGAVIPTAAHKAHTAITEPVVHAAVEAHVRPPISCMPSVSPASEPPI